MHKINLTTIAGKLFWYSLLSYCIAFSSFYILTQYTQNRIAFEEEGGVFALFKEATCHNEKYCSEFTLTNEFDPAQKKLITKLNMPYRQIKSINQVTLQQDYTALLDSLPWHVRRQFGNTIEIRSVTIEANKK